MTEYIMRWIPLSDQEPPLEEDVLCLLKEPVKLGYDLEESKVLFGCLIDVAADPKSKFDKMNYKLWFLIDRNFGYDDVIAWMPLPGTKI